jgi:hypothetical protein
VGARTYLRPVLMYFQFADSFAQRETMPVEGGPTKYCVMMGYLHSALSSCQPSGEITGIASEPILSGVQIDIRLLSSSIFWGQTLLLYMYELVLAFVPLAILILIRKKIDWARSLMVQFRALLCLAVFTSVYFQRMLSLSLAFSLSRQQLTDGCLLAHLAISFLFVSSSQLQKDFMVTSAVMIFFTLCNYPFIGRAIIDTYWDNLPSPIRRQLRNEWAPLYGTTLINM